MDPRRLPIGSVNVRADGKAWRKDGSGSFSYVGEARGGGAGGMSSSDAWEALSRALSLDGFSPPPEVHPSQVEVDLEGDIDSKPVLTWDDAAGVRHSSYTRAFHAAKAHAHSASSASLSERLEKAYSLVEATLEASGGSHPVDAAVLAHLHGHRLPELLAARGAHASVDGGALPISKSLDVDIEVRAGEVRRKESWQAVLPFHYGSIRGLRGADGDDVDVIINPAGESDLVVAVEQLDREDGSFDEYKFLLNFPSVLDALRAYAAAYPVGHYGGHLAMTREQFEGWVEEARKSGVSPIQHLAVDVNKSLVSLHRPHPHRVTMVLTHRHGHVYPTSIVNQHLADYVMQHSSPGEPLFPASHEDVHARLTELGIGDVAPSDIRHHAMRRAAADALSKSEKVDLSAPDGFDRFKANLKKASDHVGERFGHPPLHEGMSFVHPHVALAYAEECNGASVWPKVFQKGEVCVSPSSDEGSSSEAMVSSILKPPPSPPLPNIPTDLPLLTPTPSLERSLTIRGKPWWEVADQVEESLGDLYYQFRLPPLAGNAVPRYFYESPPFSPDDYVKGTVFYFHGGRYKVCERVHGSPFFFADHHGEVREFRIEGDEILPCFIEKSLTAADHAAFKRKMESLKPKKNWKIKQAMSRLSGLARKARRGDLDASAALRNFIDLINRTPDHGCDVPVSKSELHDLEEGLHEEPPHGEVVESFFHLDGSLTLHIAKAASGPGPEGEPLGTIREHADGSKWEKRDDGWHELGGGHEDKPDKAPGQPGRPAGGGGQQSQQPRQSAVYAQSVAVLGRLKAMYDATSDPEEKRILGQQIAVVRNRIAAAEKVADAGQITPENRTKERDVSKAYAEAFPELARIAGRHTSLKGFYASVYVAGTNEQVLLNALVEQHGDRTNDIVKGWLR